MKPTNDRLCALLAEMTEEETRLVGRLAQTHRGRALDLVVLYMPEDATLGEMRLLVSECEVGFRLHEVEALLEQARKDEDTAAIALNVWERKRGEAMRLEMADQVRAYEHVCDLYRSDLLRAGQAIEDLSRAASRLATEAMQLVALTA